MKLVNKLMMLMFTVLLGTHMAANAQPYTTNPPSLDPLLVEPGPISVPDIKPYTLEEVRRAILEGALRHHWHLESEAPGTIRIKLQGRDYLLVMDVVYDTKSYSIKYVSSEGLRYSHADAPAKGAAPNFSSGRSGGGATIHHSYTRWMKYLTDAINVELNIIKL